MLEKTTKKQVVVPLLIIFIVYLIALYKDLTVEFPFNKINLILVGILFLVLLEAFIKSYNRREKRIVTAFFIIVFLLSLKGVVSASIMIILGILTLLLWGYMFYEVELFYQTTGDNALSKKHDIRNIVITLFFLFVGMGIDYLLVHYFHR